MKKLLAGLFMMSAMGLSAQDKMEMKPAIGLYGGLNINMHSPSFIYNQEITLNVPFDESKTAYGFNVGLIGYIPISEVFVISPRIGYNSMSGLLEKTGTPVVTGEAAPIMELDAKLGYLEISPILQLHNLVPVKNLYFLAGLELGIPMSKSYDYKMVENGTTLNPVSADIPDASVRIAAAVGAGWIFELSETVKLGAEVSYRIPFSKVSSSTISTANFDKWNVSQLRAGLNLTFDIFGKKEEKKEEPKPQATLDLKMNTINSVTRDGKRTPMKAVRVEDMQYTELFPYLPYVFFDEAKVEPNANVQVMSAGNEKGKFSIATLNQDAMEINYRTLDIMGVRMQENPNSKITITGTNDNKKEKSTKTISTQRAEFAKDYLVKNYGIKEDRITVTATGLPAKASSSNVADGIAENRRIEISGSDAKLFEPILITGENQRVATPDLVEFVPTVTSSDSVVYWKMDLNQAGKTLKSMRGTSQPKAIQWNIAPNDLANKQMPVEYNLTVKNISNVEKNIKGTIPVEYLSISKKKAEELADKTVAKYSLMLFDFDKAEVSAADMAIIEKHILPAIKFNSTVEIYGYTDRIGDDNYNKQLAEKRAEAVKKILEAKVPSAKYNVQGVGESVSIFDNESPVGRHLSRTVQVLISTPR